MDVEWVKACSHWEIFPSKFELQSIECNEKELTLGEMRYEAFRFIIRMDGNSIDLISSYSINLWMLPYIIAVEIESSYVLLPPYQDRRVIIDTNTPHFLCIWDVCVQRDVVWIYSEVENIGWCLLLGHKWGGPILSYIDLPQPSYS